MAHVPLSQLPASQDRSLGEVAYQAIKREIVRCGLAPGTEHTEMGLAGRFNFGRAAVRVALMRLTHEGLVHGLPRRGYFISPVTLRDIQDIFELRLLLEPAAARRAAGQVDGVQLHRLNALCQAGYSPDDSDSAAAFLQANKELHVTIARASGNERLAETLGRLLDEMERLFHLGLALRDRTLEMQHEHSSLVEALVAGDGKQAEQIAAEQIETAQKMVVDAVLASSSVRNAGIVLTPPGPRASR
jgi:DNA-binding GntR family transcriptional regulator